MKIGRLDRRNGGLFILPPDWNDPSDISKGDLRFFHNNRDYFNRGKSLCPDQWGANLFQIRIIKMPLAPS